MSVPIVESCFFVGVDIGQAKDPTAIAAVERRLTVWPGELDGATYEARRDEVRVVRFLQRMKLGTPYPDVASRILEVLEKLSADECELVVDATGVGRPIVDYLRLSDRLKVSMTAVMITGGDKTRTDGGYTYVPKRDLVAGLVMAFQRGRVRIAERLAEAGALTNELVNFRVKVSAAGHDSYGARESEHDDLVLATALACWRISSRYDGASSLGGGRLPIG